MKVFSSIVLMSLISFSAVCQEYDFKVMINSGNNKVMKKEATSWVNLKNGLELVSGDKLNIMENGYVVLIHQSGNHVELKSAGEKEIDQILIENEGGLTGKYLGYVLSKMAPEEQEKNRKKYTDITGATERGFNIIDLFMSSSSPVYNTEVIIRWSNMGLGKKYMITLENMFDEVIKELESDYNYLVLDLADEDLHPHQLVSVRVSLEGEPNINSQKFSIQRISKDELGKYKSELEELLAALEPDSPISHLIMAEFYEEHKLLLDASTCYEHAIRNSKGTEYFEQAYKEYLMRNGWSDTL